MNTEPPTMPAVEPAAGVPHAALAEDVATSQSAAAAPARHPARNRAALAAVALGAVAVGALAIGALAVGALAIGRLAVKRARIGTLQIDKLIVRDLDADLR